MAAQGVESTLAPENGRVVPNLSAEARERVLIDRRRRVVSWRVGGPGRGVFAGADLGGMAAAIVGVVEERAGCADDRIGEKRAHVSAVPWLLGHVPAPSFTYRTIAFFAVFASFAFHLIGADVPPTATIHWWKRQANAKNQRPQRTQTGSQRAITVALPI